MKTFLPKIDLKKLGEPDSNATDSRGWRIIDADGLVLGHVAEKIANVLRGRDKPTYTPHLDTGDFVVVINAEKVRVTGNKENTKEYQRYSGYRGGLKRIPFATVREKNPERLIMSAVKGMLPKNRLGTKLLTKLKVYKGSEHPHAAQKPEPLILS
ncbi:MAG: 50S ribosomal protein L13 [Verrucomicrobiota bacterium]|jgi:large subunit ribosomal protein L13|nr:50S ribosomal protein L13 [Verrucomicrobiota bacterium]MEE2714673.1 50S ribosomal protein L13 [Verrucomicrobiota bacterium]MEE2813187.1 50S ribosomal protein L13 [Verrucomicrobiota bacterium]